jgi:hypothetical protein
MSAARKIKSLEEFLAEMKAEDIKRLCERNETDSGGTKKTMMGRLLIAGDIKEIDFLKVDLDELTFMQVFTKCVAEGLPSIGKRSEIQAILREHLRGPGGKTGKKNGKGTDRDFLTEHGLNTKGGTADFAKRRKLFQDGKHDREFDEMGVGRLNAFADLYGLQPSCSRREVLESLKDRFDKRKQGDHDSKADVEERALNLDVQLDARNGPDPSGAGGLGYEKGSAPDQVKRGDDFADHHAPLGGNLQAQALVAILEQLNANNIAAQAKAAKKELHPDKPPASDKDGKALNAYLAKLQPHLVPLVYEGNPETLGLHIARAIDFCSELDDDIAIVTLYGQTAEKKKAVLELFRSRHYVAERNFCSLIIKSLGWAASIEEKKGIVDAKTKRADQARSFNIAFEKMTEQIRDYCDRVEFGEDFYQEQIKLCAQAAIGIVVSKAAIKSMEVASSWRETLEKKFGSKAGSSTPSVRNPYVPPAAQPPRQPAPAQNFSHRDAAAGGRDKRQKADFGPPNMVGNGNGRQVGTAMVCSQHVAGSNVKGMRVKGKGSNCEVCKGEHFAFECPRAFGEAFPGRSMPGWNEKGERIEACWNGTDITERTLEQWQRMQRQGWFCKNPFGEGGRQAPPFSFA